MSTRDTFKPKGAPLLADELVLLKAYDMATEMQISITENIGVTIDTDILRDALIDAVDNVLTNQENTS